MAVMPNEIPVTREVVYGWIADWNEDHKDMTLEEYITQRLAEIGLADTKVSTTGHETLGDTTPLIDFILMDAESYLNHPDNVDSRD
jgi:hypothetical protein